MALMGCAPTIADLRDDVGSMTREDALSLAGEAWDAWHNASLERDPSPANIEALDRYDAEWEFLYGTAVHATEHQYPEAIRDVILFLRARGAL
jgi:hypothetical protein